VREEFPSKLPKLSQTHFWHLCKTKNKTYGTRNPMMATVGAVVIIIFTSLAFLVYDFLVRQEFHDAQAVLEAKRQFMRYVSHGTFRKKNSSARMLSMIDSTVNYFDI